MELKGLKIEIDKFVITRALDIYVIMQTILARENSIDINSKEHFWTIALNQASKIINIELVSLGSIRATFVNPKEVLSIPLQKKARGLMLVHNHPSGNLMPSEADKDITDLLIQACRIMEIPVLDHIIITEHSYFSFQESGLLDTLKESKKYMPAYEIERQLTKRLDKEHKKEIDKAVKEMKKLNEREVKILLNEKKEMEFLIEQKAIEIAKRMLADGVEKDLIIKFTGLSIEEIEQLM